MLNLSGHKLKGVEDTCNLGRAVKASILGKEGLAKAVHDLMKLKGAEGLIVQPSRRFEQLKPKMLMVSPEDYATTQFLKNRTQAECLKMRLFSEGDQEEVHLPNFSLYKMGSSKLFSAAKGNFPTDYAAAVRKLVDRGELEEAAIIDSKGGPIVAAVHTERNKKILNMTEGFISALGVKRLTADGEAHRAITQMFVNLYETYDETLDEEQGRDFGQWICKNWIEDLSMSACSQTVKELGRLELRLTAGYSGRQTSDE